MIYEITHRTAYTYEDPVTISHHLARLSPSERKGQRLHSHEVTIEPTPATSNSHIDYFGNQALFFAMRGAHRSLVVTAKSRIEVLQKLTPDALATPAWETLRDSCRADTLTPDAEAGEFSFPSHFIKCNPQFAEYALQTFTPGRPIMAAAMGLNSRIHREFAFDPKATDVATPIEEAFLKRRGVCQDFAHIFIACVRSIGLPARYMSGYLETLPPPGKTKMVGADASHAWASVWCGESFGWIEFDPTNDCIPGQRHIAVAHGRDFADVSPLRGVVYGPGSHKLKVAVDVNPVK